MSAPSWLAMGAGDFYTTGMQAGLFTDPRGDGMGTEPLLGEYDQDHADDHMAGSSRLE